MKHSIVITLILISVFVLSQVVGLYTVNRYIEVEDVNGTIVISHPTTFIGEPPEIDNKSYSFIPLILTILVGTAFIFVLIRYRLGVVWKYWFLFAVVMTISLALDVLFDFKYSGYAAFAIALLFGALKVFHKNLIIHNLTEIFIYTGIAIAIIPYLNLFSAIMMLIAISIYDAIAVWKSKHMIKLAEFQTESKLFAGLMIPYSFSKAESVAADAQNVKTVGKKATKSAKVTKTNASKSDSGREGKWGRTAILGGGDIAFPLLFTAAVMQHLIINAGVDKLTAFWYVLIITATTTAALAGLLLYGKEDRFYPAMPFISLGCIIGFLIVLSF